jgi:hypothetical protein
MPDAVTPLGAVVVVAAAAPALVVVDVLDESLPQAAITAAARSVLTATVARVRCR